MNVHALAYMRARMYVRAWIGVDMCKSSKFLALSKMYNDVRNET